MNLRFSIGVLLGVAIGMACRWFGIPSPAPPVFVGALLVVAMTLGYQLTDRVLAHRPTRTKGDSGGPTGYSRGESPHD